MIERDPTAFEDQSSSLLPSPNTFNPNVTSGSVKRRRAITAPAQRTDATPSTPVGSPTVQTMAPPPSPKPVPVPSASPTIPPAPPSASPAVSGIPGMPGGPTQPYYSPPNALGQGHAIPAPTFPLQPSSGGLFTPPVPASGTSVPTSPIDPANDLRSMNVLPTSSSALDAARQGLISATGTLSTQDRVQSMQDLLSKFGLSTPDIAAGPAVAAGPSEQGALDTLNGQVGTAGNVLAGFNRGQTVNDLRDALTKYFGDTDVAVGANPSTDPSARLSQYNAMLDDSASKLASVDRVALAKDLLSQFDDAQLPEHELALRKLTEQYAARGGGRSGQLRTAYGDEDLARQRDRDLMKRQLISDALEGSIQDQFNKTNALAGLQSSTFGQDQGIRGEERADRDYATGVETGNVNRRLSTRQAADQAANAGADANLSALSSTFGQLAGQQGATAAREANRRAEQRTERDTQTGLAERNAERALSAADSNRAFASSLADAVQGDNATNVSAAQNLFNTLSSEGAANRAETRGERDYQNALEGQSYQRAVTQQQLEEQARQQQLQQALALLSAGEAGNPSAALTSLANGTGLDLATIQQLAQALGSRQNTQTASQPGAGLPIPTGIQLPDYGGILS